MAEATAFDTTFRVLLIDGGSESSFAAALSQAGFALTHSHDLESAARLLHRGEFPVAVYHEPPNNGDLHALLAADQEIAPRVKLIVWTERGSLASAKAALNAGVFAYAEAADGPEELVRQVRRGFRQSLSQRAFAAAAKVLHEPNNGFAETRFQRLIEAMPVLMNAFDDQGRVVVWNRQCAEVTGYSAAEIVGNPHAVELLYPDAKYRQQMMAAWAHSGDFHNWELELTCKDGTRRTVAWSNISLEAPIEGWHSWAMGVDVTERRRAEQELRERGAELARAMRLASLGELVAELAHEVKQPLYAVANYCDALEQYLAWDLADPTGRARHCLAEIETQANRAAAVVDRIGRQVKHAPVELAPESIAAMVREATAWMAGELRRSGTEVTANLPHALPRVLADRVQIEQVLVNLIRNALEAMRDLPAGERRIEVSAERLGDRVRVTVADRGRGVPPEDRERIFDPLFTTRPGGTGMGLAICRRIVADHAGDIGVSDRAAGGAAIYFTLPLAVESQNHD